MKHMTGSGGITTAGNQTQTIERNSSKASVAVFHKISDDDQMVLSAAERCSSVKMLHGASAAHSSAYNQHSPR